MVFTEAGILEPSVRYFFTPSSFAEQILFYATRIGHYYCNTEYHFSYQSEIGQNPTHNQHFMLMLIRGGSMRFRINMEDYEAKEGDIVLFDCKEPHEYVSLSEQMEFYWLVFDGLTFDILYNKILELHGKRHVFDTSSQSELQSLLERVLSDGEGSVRIQETTRSEILYSILCCLFLTQKRSGSSFAASLVEDSMHYMDRNYQKQLSVKQIAAASGVSASHLTRCFREQTGYSPHEYLTIRRISRAKELLLSTNRTIHQIAEETGYQSDENFVRSFKKSSGLSPGMFRKTQL